MLRRYICCFSSGGACDRPSKVNNSSTDPTNRQQLAANPTPKSTKSPSHSPVLVELFTSQGCSSCPPADLLISQLGRGKSHDIPLQVPIIILTFHVEYWDYLGWKDPFANSSWTLRQRNYGQSLQQDSIYTPEVVVQGRAHCIASALDPILTLIHSAPKFPALELTATYNLTTDPFILQVTLEGVVRTKVDGFTLDVMFALHENGLVTNCERGENKGRVLVNDFVVRSMAKATTLQNSSGKKHIKVEFPVPLWANFAKTRCGAVVFLQNPSNMEIFGAQSLVLPDELQPYVGVVH